MSKRSHIMTIILILITSTIVMAGESAKTPGNQTDVYHWQHLIVNNDTLLIDLYFDSVSIKLITDSLLSDYHDSGYYYASVRFEQIQRTGNQVTVTAGLNSGPRVMLGQLNFTGLKRTDPVFLKRLISSPENSELTASVIRQVEQDAQAVGYVRFNPPAVIEPRAGYTTADLALRFTEWQQFQFEGIVGYLPSDGDRLNWDIDFKMNNLFGRGKAIRLTSAKQERGRNLLELGYRQPLVLLGRGYLNINVLTRDYRDSFYEFFAGAELGNRFSRSFEGAIGIDVKNVEPSDDATGYRRYSARWSLLQQSLDNPANPSGGYSLNWQLGYSYRRYRSVSDDNPAKIYNETRLAVEARLFQPLIMRAIGYIRIGYEGLETKEPLPPLSELYLIGGPGTLRSFRNQQFTAIRYGYSTVETRFRFENGYSFIFSDIAYLNNRQQVTDEVKTIEEFKYGYGLGLAVIQKQRSVVISLGWNKDTAFDQPRLSIEFSSGI